MFKYRLSGEYLEVVAYGDVRAKEFEVTPETPVARVTQALSTKLSTWKEDRRHIDVPDDAAALATLFMVRPIS